MIVSDRFKYVFVEQPLTASTATAAELMRYYEGRQVLSKHSNYSDFLSIADANQREYAVVIGVRHPLDQIVSGYQKLKVNHGNAYDNPALFEENGGWISKHRRRMFRFVHTEGHDFEDYFRKFFGRPRVKISQYLWSPRKYDFIIRFEELQRDFGRFLDFIGAERVRELPVLNKTEGKRDFMSYYTPGIRGTARYVFGPIMSAWGYEFPAEWETRTVPRSSAMQFQVVNYLARLVVGGIGVTPGHYRRLRIALRGKAAGR